jgi:phosphohistidine phosphatase
VWRGLFRDVLQLRLLLLRHAKSDWAEAEADDHDRPLSERGREAAPRIGAYMRAKGYEPSAVLCSTSRRTKETLKLLQPEFKHAPKIRYLRTLYLAEWPALLATVQKAPASASPLLVIGHNPGLEQLAIALALRPKTAAEKARTERLAQKFPTGALAVLDFELPAWKQIKPGLGELTDFVRPKDLTGHKDRDQ